MAKTFFEGTSKSHGDTVTLTRFLGSAHLLESEKTRDCLQVTIGSEGRHVFARLTYSEAWQLRHQLTRFLSHIVSDGMDPEDFKPQK